MKTGQDKLKCRCKELNSNRRNLPQKVLRIQQYMALVASDTGFENSHKEKTDIKRQR
mgnify:CR=1 FL=1